MPSLTAWLYPTAFGAGTGELHLRGLVEHGALQVHDAATVTWMLHDPEPKVRPITHLTARAAGDGAFWGALVGLALLNPIAGAAAGATAGTAAQRLRSVGLDEEFVAGVREQVRPGTSALLALTSGADPTAVREFLARSEAVLLQAELSDEGRRVLEAAGPLAPPKSKP